VRENTLPPLLPLLSSLLFFSPGRAFPLFFFIFSKLGVVEKGKKLRGRARPSSFSPSSFFSSLFSPFFFFLSPPSFLLSLARKLRHGLKERMRRVKKKGLDTTLSSSLLPFPCEALFLWMFRTRRRAGRRKEILGRRDRILSLPLFSSVTLLFFSLFSS